MVATFRRGTARSEISGGAVAQYLLHETLAPERDSIAAYYLGEVPPLEHDLVARLGRELNEGSIEYQEAVAQLYEARIALVPTGRAIDHEAIYAAAGDDLVQAAQRADFYQVTAEAGGTVAELRRDLSAEMAAALGITDIYRPLGETEIASLVQAKRVDGHEIEGRTKRSATLSIADAFGLPGKGPDAMPPTGPALENVLAGRRMDGQAPRNAKGEALSPGAVDGARKRLLAIYGVNGREATDQELGNIRRGKLAGGGELSGQDWRRKVNATAERVTFLDLTLSAPKSLSVAWALAPNPAEQAVMLSIHKDAVASTMTYIANDLAVARRGDGGSKGTERGEIAYISFSHYTARPALDIEGMQDGEAYTQRVEVPTVDADPQLHTHSIIPNVIRTPSGHIGSIDLDRLGGKIHEYGSVYHAFVATNAREHGIAVGFDERHGTAMLTDVPQHVVDTFSKRSRDAREAAAEYARSQGQDLDSLSPEAQATLLRAGSDTTRQNKAERTRAERSDFEGWREQAAARGYQHRTLLNREPPMQELPDMQRRIEAMERSLPRIDRLLQQRAVIEGQDLRIEAARGLIHTGIGEPGADVAAITRMFREGGVRQDGEQTAIKWTDGEKVRGKARVRVTTELHERQEREVIRLAQIAGADRSRALTAAQIDQAAELFAQRHPGIDRNGEQWRRQVEMMHGLAGSGALTVGIGIAGAGKSTAIAPLTEAWRDAGRTVHAAALAWRQAADFEAAGIPEQSRRSIASFIRAADKGKLALDRDAVVVVDEVALLSTKQLLGLTQLQERHGFQLVMIGDPKQGQAIEAGRVYGLLEQALGEAAIPAIMSTVRQRAEDDRLTATLWRDGRAAEAIERKIATGEFQLVTGGEQKVIERTADLWLERRQANRDDPGYTLHVETRTNAEARAVSLAIRERQRTLGELGPDVREVAAIDGNTGERYPMRLAVGDVVRVFEARVFDANTPGRANLVATNGQQLSVTGVTDAGIAVRNEATGAEGTMAWQKLRAGRDEPFRLAYAAAATLATSQGVTRSETIFAMPSGSAGIDGFAAYVADSRRVGRGYIVANEAAERRQITQRRAIGGFAPIRSADIVRNVAENLSRQPERTNATELLERSDRVQRGAVRGLQMGSEPGERRRSHERDGLFRRAHAYALHRLDLSPAIERVLDYARELSARLVRRQEQEIEGPRHERGRYLGLSR